MSLSLKPLKTRRVEELMHVTPIEAPFGVVLKASDRGWLCHEFEPSTTKDPPCRAAMHAKSVESETSSRWCGVVVRRGCQLRCRPRHLTMVQNYVVRRQKPSCS
ncbi:uncharacterized protein TNCV_3007841 [Trichonephila clavipes]|nr:uncharacterized protein TNCV_3007841 [Trichonephila clavipes]